MTARLGVQMYTLRDFTKTPADIAATLKKLHDQGWRAIQASAMGPIEAKELRKMLDDLGMVCAATHRSLDQMRDTAKLIDEHETLGCRYTAIGGHWPKRDEPFGESWPKFVTEYNAVAKSLAGKSVRIGYHNHSHELARIGEGRKDPTALDLLVKELSNDVWFEIDTYWIAHGGGDPAAWIDRVAGRIPAVHLKDMAVVGLNESKPVMAEVGEGNLNWPRILDSCRRAGVEWYIIEQDTCQRDPFESVAISIKNVRAMGLT